MQLSTITIILTTKETTRRLAPSGTQFSIQVLTIMRNFQILLKKIIKSNNRKKQVTKDESFKIERS
jgi:hypothetical protein